MRKHAKPMTTDGRLPDFVVIGAPKAGTTSLDLYLGLHPQIQMAKPKEPRFFVDAPPPAGRWELGLDWYRSLFRGRKPFCGETSPNYAGAPSIPGVPFRMQATIPNAKIVYMVRQPYERLRSHYLMDFRKGNFSGSFQDYVDNNKRSLDLTCYGRQFAEYLRYFPENRIHIVETAELQKERIATLAAVFRFLQVEDSFVTPLFFHKRHIGAKECFPTPLGRWILASKPMLAAKNSLHGGVYYHCRNTILRFFSQPPPATDLPDSKKQELVSLFREEVRLLRNLSGLPLRSLGPE